MNGFDRKPEESEDSFVHFPELQGYMQRAFCWNGGTQLVAQWHSLLHHTISEMQLVVWLALRMCASLGGAHGVAGSRA